MKTVLNISFDEGQGRGEVGFAVLRGHTNVQLFAEFNGQSVDVYLKPGDALRLADAIRAAAEEVSAAN